MYRGKKATLAVTFAILMLTIVPGLVRFLPIQAVAAKPQPPSSTSTSWAKAYAFQYDYSAAYSVRQLPDGGFIVGGSCESGTAPTTCNGYATVIRVDASGNLQSQSQYSYPGHPESTALNLIRPTTDGGAILAGQPQSGSPETGLTGCAAIVKTDSNGNIQWAKDLQYSVTGPYSTPPPIPLTSSKPRTEHMSWPGTLSLRTVTIRGLLSSAQPDKYSGSTFSRIRTANT